MGLEERNRSPVWYRDLLLAATESERDYAADQETADAAGLSVGELRAVRGY